MHSEMPNLIWGETWAKKHYCKKKDCQQQAVVDKLKDKKQFCQFRKTVRCHAEMRSGKIISNDINYKMASSVPILKP